jgi:hypothetical protein
MTQNKAQEAQERVRREYGMSTTAAMLEAAKYVVVFTTVYEKACQQKKGIPLLPLKQFCGSASDVRSTDTVSIAIRLESAMNVIRATHALPC